MSSASAATITRSAAAVRLTIFSSIAEIAPALRKAAPALNLKVIHDDSLGGYGGTVNFDPSKLSQATKEQLAQTEVLVTEPIVLAQLLFQAANATTTDSSSSSSSSAPSLPLLLPNLKWCQSTYAGVDPLFHAASAAAAASSSNNSLDLLSSLPFVVTRFAGKFGPPIAEWCLARMIGHERKFAATAQDQTRAEWAGSRQQVTTYRYMSDLTLVILGGAGDIGLCIGRIARQAFGMRVLAFGKTPRNYNNKDDTDDENDDATTTRRPDGMDLYTTDLTEALQQADYIISVLPSTPQTRGLLSGDALAPAGGAVFLNVGRGDVVDEESLIRALDRGYISAAILDVFATEPLPKESPLWRHPNVIVSPHVSGITRAEDVPDIVLKNYQNYVEGKELLFQVDWSKGY